MLLFSPGIALFKKRRRPVTHFAARHKMECNLKGGIPMCNGNCTWLIIILILLCCCGGNGFGCGNNDCGCGNNCGCGC